MVVYLAIEGKMGRHGLMMPFCTCFARRVNFVSVSPKSPADP